MQPSIATYHNAVFGPEQPVEFPEGVRVKRWIVPEPEDAERLNDLLLEE